MRKFGKIILLLELDEELIEEFFNNRPGSKRKIELIFQNNYINNIFEKYIFKDLKEELEIVFEKNMLKREVKEFIIFLVKKKVFTITIERQVYMNIEPTDKNIQELISDQLILDIIMNSIEAIKEFNLNEEMVISDLVN